MPGGARGRPSETDADVVSHRDFAALAVDECTVHLSITGSIPRELTDGSQLAALLRRENDSMHRPARARLIVRNLIKCAWTIWPGVRPSALVFAGVKGRDEKLDDCAVRPGRDERLEQILFLSIHRHSLKFLRAVVSKVQLRRHILDFFVNDTDRNSHSFGRRRQGRGVGCLEDHWREVIGVYRVFYARRAAVGLAGYPVLTVAGWQIGLAQLQRAPSGIVPAMPNPAAVTFL